MFKPGIVTLAQLRRAGAAPASGWRASLRRYPYVGLYEEAAALDEDEAARLQEVVLDLFVTANGAFKRTSRARFPDFDREVAQQVRQTFSGRANVSVHDMAVSDARTACDFFDALRQCVSGELEFFASDFCIRVFALECRGERTIVVVDDENRPLQLVRGPFVLPVPKQEGKYFPVNRVLRARLLQTVVPRILALATRKDPSISRREIPLVCSRARDYTTRSPGFQIGSYDIMQPAPRRYELVRAMNVLNRRYFADPLLRVAVDHVANSLAEGGLFVTGSNEDAGSGVAGSIFRKEGGRFVAVSHAGAGSPIRDLIVSDRSAALRSSAPEAAQGDGGEG